MDLLTLAPLIEKYKVECSQFPSIEFDSMNNKPQCMGVINLSQDSWYRESCLLYRSSSQ